MEYMPQVKVTKEDFLALSDLAGDMSIMDYMSKVIHEHVAVQQSVPSDPPSACPSCGLPPVQFHVKGCPLDKSAGS